jgi:phage-related protein/predicted  nucleic acid-binding Zn-ribbon protein
VEKDLQDLNTTASRTGSQAGTNWSKSFVDAFKKNKVRLSDTGLDQAEREYLAAQARMEKTTLAGAKKRTDAEKKYSDALEDSVKASKEFGPWSGEYKKSLDAVTDAQRRLNQVTKETAEEQEALQAEVEASSESLTKLRKEIDGIENAAGPAWAKGIRKNLHIAFTSVGEIADDAGREMGVRLSESFKDTIRKQNIGAAVGASLGRLSGARALMDFAEAAKDSALNADRLAVAAGNAGLRIGGLGLVAVGATGSILALSGGLGSMLSTALVLPGILAAVATGAVVFRVALSDISNVLPDVTEAYKGLGDIIKENFWERAAAPMRDAAFRLLPVLSAGLAEVSNQFGGWAVAISSVVGSAKGLQWIGDILENIGVMADIMGDGVGAFANGLLELTYVGSTYLPRLGEALSVLAYKFENFVQMNTENGNIFRWVENGITEFKNLGAVIAGTISIFGSLYEASRRAGGPSGFGFLRAGIDSVSNALKTAGWQDALTSLFSGAYEGLGSIGAGLVAVADGFRVISPALGTVFSLVGETLGVLLQGLGDFMSHPAVAEGLVNFFTSVKNAIADTIPSMELVAPAFKAIATMAGQLVEAVGGVMDAALNTFAPAFLTISEAAAPLIPILSDIVQNIIEGMGPAVNFVAGLLGDLLDFIVPLLGRLSEMEWLWKGLGTAISLVIIPLVAIAGPLMFLVGTFFRVLGVVRLVVGGFIKLASEFRNFGGAVKNTVSNSKTLTAALNGIKNAASKVGNFFKAIFKPAIDGVGKAFGFLKGHVVKLIEQFGGKGLLSVLGSVGKRFIGLLGPIGLVISIIWLLVDGVRYAWNNFEWFRDGVTGVWNWIRDAISNVVTWFIDTAMPALGTALTAVGGFFSGLWVNYVQPVWGWIQTTVGGFVNWFTLTAIPAVQNVITTLGNAFSWLYTSIVQPVFNGIQTAIDIALWPVRVLLGGLYLLIRDVIGPGFVWLYQNAVRPAFTGIGNAISGAWNNVIRPVFGFIHRAVDGLVGVFQNSGTHIRNVWTSISNALRAGYVYMNNLVFNPMRRAVGWVADSFAQVRDRIGVIWNNLRVRLYNGYVAISNTALNPLRRAVSWVGDRFASVRDRIGIIWGNLRDLLRRGYEAINNQVFRPLHNALGGVQDRFATVRDRIASIWDNMRDHLQRGWEAISNRVFTPLRNGVARVQTAFERAQEGIGTAWERIREAVRQPVAGVVNNVINPFIGGYNDLNNAWSGDDLDPIKGFHTGGYTGRGSKYQAAGIVHADEYVVRKKARRKFERENPGVLDHINATGEMPKKQPRKHSVDGMSAGVPGGPRGGIWGRIQHAMSQAGQVTFTGSALGVNVSDAVKAWQGRSALQVNAGSGGGPRISAGAGGAGPWGYYSGSNLFLNPRGPSSKKQKVGTMVHEMGHAMSLNHAGTNSVMHPMMKGGWWSQPADWAKMVEVFGKPGGKVKTYSASEVGQDGGGSWIDPIGWIVEKFNKIIGKTRENAANLFAGNTFASMPLGLFDQAVENLKNSIKDKVGSWLNPFDGGGGGSSDDKSTSGAKSPRAWKSTVIEALGKAGLPNNDAYVNAWIAQIASESGGNPSAIQQVKDVNSGGNEAAGLVQVTPGTFAAHRDKSLPNNRLDPLASLVAGMNYAKSRYGKNMLSVIGKGHGYSEGGRVTPYNLFDKGGFLRKTGEPQLIQHKKSRPDAVLTAQQWKDQRKIAQAAGERLTGVSKDNMELHVHANGVDVDEVARRGVEDFAWHLKHQMGG